MVDRDGIGGEGVEVGVCRERGQGGDGCVG